VLLLNAEAPVMQVDITAESIPEIIFRQGKKAL
jgi:hypothetical protein